MNSLEMTSVAVTDFTEEIFYKMQGVEPEKIMMEYCNTIGESAAESAKNVRDGVKTIIAKIMTNVFEEEMWEGQNPMILYLVIRNVLKYLPIKDLCSARQVCRLWNEEACTYLRQIQRIKFYPEGIEKMTTFTNFVMNSQQVIEKYKGPPFSTYSFTATAQYPTTPFPSNIMKEFVATCGQYVRKLEVYLGRLSTQDFTAFFLQGMPNLQSIHFINLPQTLTRSSFLNNFKHNQSQRDQDFKNDNSLMLNSLTHLRIDRSWQILESWRRNFLQDLLSLMPNLIEYELWTWNSTTEDEHSEPYIVSLSQQNIKTLKTLRPGVICDHLGVTIANLGLKLTKLYLPVLSRNVSTETVEKLLSSQKYSLEELEINFSTLQDFHLLNFPRMEKLSSLHLMITQQYQNDYTLFTHPVDYNAQFPRIKVFRLELTVYNDSNFIQYFFPQVAAVTKSCETMEELDISFSGFRDDKFIGILSRLFPNVKKLKLDGYGSRIFSQIFTHMQNLQYLELYLIYGFNLDDQMTGVSKETCARIRKCDALLDLKNEDLRIYPSLCSLKKLHTLVIKQKDYQAKFWPDAQCITDITANMAISQMKQLEYLHIESGKMFTPECQKSLANELEDCWLNFTI